MGCSGWRREKGRVEREREKEKEEREGRKEEDLHDVELWDGLVGCIYRY